MEQRQDQPSENWPCGRTTGTEVRPRVYCVCGTPPPQRLPPGTTWRPCGLGVSPHPPLCWGICSCFVCSQQLRCLDLLSLPWCGTAAGAAPLPWPPSVSGVFKDSGGSHASPDAHGHHPVGPGEGDTQVGWRLGHQALAGKAELGAPGPRGRQTSGRVGPSLPPRRAHRVTDAYCRPGSPVSSAWSMWGYVHLPLTPPRGQPHLFPRRFSSLSSVMTCRAPVQPSGWPKATAPPRGFTFSRGSFSFSTQNTAWGEVQHQLWTPLWSPLPLAPWLQLGAPGHKGSPD